MSNNWIEKACKDLNDLISKMALRDYKAVNFTKTGKKRKKHIPYSLGEDTMQAMELYKKINGQVNVSKEIEAEVKLFLLKYRTLGDDLI